MRAKRTWRRSSLQTYASCWAIANELRARCRRVARPVSRWLPQEPRPAQHGRPHLPCASQLLGLECVGVVDMEQAELAALHVGSALGLATLLRGTAFHASKGCSYIPADVASRHSVNLSQVHHWLGPQPARRPSARPPARPPAHPPIAPARSPAHAPAGTAGRVFACASRRGGGARHRGRVAPARRKELAAVAP